MSSIEELRSRFEAAEERLERAGAEQQDFGGHLVDLMGKIEGTLRRYKNECVAQKEETQRLIQENEELHDMLNKLLTRVERGQFGENLADLTLKLQVLEMPSSAATKGEFTSAEAAQAPAPEPEPEPEPENSQAPEAEVEFEAVPQGDNQAAEASAPGSSVEEMLENLIATATGDSDDTEDTEDNGLRIEPLMPEAFYTATSKTEATSVESVVQRVSDLVKGLTHAENSDTKTSIH